MKQFLIDYLAWVDSGATKDHWLFSRGAGLCLNYYRYIQKHNDDLALELIRDGLSPVFPFATLEEFKDESRNYTCHLNEKRIAWARSKI